MSKDIVPTDMSDLASEYLSDVEIKFPHITIGQGSPKKGEVGKFNIVSGKDVKSVDRLESITYIRQVPGNFLGYGRAMVPRPENLYCASDDGINPALRIEHPVNAIANGGCLNCPALRWSKDKNDQAAFDSEFKRELALKLGYPTFETHKPLCNRSMNMILFDKDRMPMRLQLMTHNLAVLQKIDMILKTLSISKRVPGFALTFDLWLTKMNGEGNRHLLNVSQSSDWKIVDLEEATARQFDYKLYKANAQKMIAAQYESMHAAAQIREVAQVSAPPADEWAVLRPAAIEAPGVDEDPDRPKEDLPF